MSAGEVDVRVLGTKFNLKSYAEDSEVEVTLVEGSVEMETKLGGDDRIVRLRPGELVKLDKRTGSTETFDVPTDTYRPVVCGGGLFFMDKRFDEIVAYLEKRFDVKINVADRALAERRFIASFVNGESLDEMLASFNADEAMRIRREGRIVNITKR
jgi:fe2+-dicitrate sensor, membrane component